MEALFFLERDFGQVKEKTKKSEVNKTIQNKLREKILCGTPSQAKKSFVFFTVLTIL